VVTAGALALAAIAVWLNGEPTQSHHERAAALLRGGKLPTMNALLKDFRGQEQGYAAAGSFCGWLLQSGGLEAFRRLYPISDPAAASLAVLKKPWATVDAEWRAYLASLGEAEKKSP
jgi:hypothetical protein